MEQWQLNPEGERLLNATWTARELVDKTINTERTPDAITLTGENFRIAFSTADGEMTELLYNGKNLIKEGLQPNFWRALTDNDVANNHLERCGIWKFAGKNAKLQSIDLKEDSNKKLATVTVNYKLEALPMATSSDFGLLLQESWRFLPIFRRRNRLCFL